MSSSQTNRREAPRFKAEFETLFSNERQEGAGLLADLSYRGARIDESSLQPKVGAVLRLYVFLQPVSPVELTGTVIRHTETGFAISFAADSPEIRRLVDDLGALVSLPKRS
jgi:hypothetical protein